ncbi:DNA polymerase III subunit delta [Alkalicaulis satelles]|uniref:DNA-directed DNA polymerase n=1 Tax=Alkalicaulis satelles TaxID=2609175 RepID=A0A5M6ZGH5_9PROT|nr:DNA polymerase III subunit delta [Alkalicaulis satelles]KAA5803843.1 DNA polymerase III subunit delta [Alkalicaulis satelles]
MKISPREAERVIDRPDRSVRAFLIYGPDTGLVRERAARLAKTLTGDPDDPFNVSRLSEDDLKSDPAALADAMAAMSLTGGERLVRVRVSGDSAPLGAYLAELDDGGAPAEARLIIEAGDLKKTAKLRKTAEAAKTCAAIACYSDETRDLIAIAEAMLGEEGLQLEPDARAALAPYLEGDRALARGEIEKLILYKGLKVQRRDGDDTVTRADITAISAAGAEAAMDQILDAALGGAPADADRAYQRALGSGQSPVGVLRALQRRLDQFDQVHAAGGDPQAMMRSGAPRFGPPAEAFKKGLRAWRGRRLDQARQRAFQAERAVKRTGAPAEAIVGDLLARLALAAAPASNRRD